jgi:hypothetical protein
LSKISLGRFFIRKSQEGALRPPEFEYVYERNICGDETASANVALSPIWKNAAPRTGTDKLKEEKKTPFEKGIKE